MNSKPVVYIVDAAVAVTGGLTAAKREALCLQEEARFVLVLPTATRILADDVPEFERLLLLPMVQLRRSLASVLLYVPSLLYCGWKLRRALREDGCTRLQVNDFYLMQGAAARLFGYRGTLATWIRIDPTRFGRAGVLWLWMAGRASDQRVAVSEFIKRRLQKGGDVRLIYDPYPDQETDIGPVASGSQQLVFIANYIEGKGQDKAISAFARIALRFPQAKLAFFGGDMGLAKNRGYRRELEEQARQQKLSDRILIGDFVTDTREVLQGARAALNLSASESFSLTCQEASACGVPVIATRCGGPEEIIEDGRTGFLVDVDDVEAIADRMAKLLEDPQLAQDMGRRGVALMAERFSTDIFRRELRSVFRLNR